MNIAKIRKLAAKAPPDVLLEIFCEAYKKVPKDKKGELDTVVLSLLQGTGSGSKEGLDQLEADIQQFADEVYGRKYCYPNLTAAQAAQSRWHAKVRSFLKVLDGIPQNTPDYGRVGRLYIALYRLMGLANRDNLFATGNPFKLLRYSQEKLLQQMVTANLYADNSPEMMAELIETICRASCHWDTYPRALQANLLPLLTPQQLETALAEAMKLSEAAAQRQKERGPQPFQAQGEFDSDAYTERRYTENVNALVLQIAYAISPERYLSCLDFYYAHDRRFGPEVQMYVALAILNDQITAAEERGEDPEEIKKTWITCYEDALGRGIAPRKELQEQYARYKG